MRSLSSGLLSHFQGEVQTRATLWFVKINNRRINVASAGGTTVTTVEDHGLLAEDSFAISNSGNGVVDDTAQNWHVHQVVDAPSPKTLTLLEAIEGGAGGTLHQVHTFTSHDANILRDGALYRADGSFTPSAAQTTDKLQVPTIEMEGIMLPLFSAGGISEDDILGGRLDFAEVRTQIVNYRNLAQGGLWVARGFIGRVTVQNDKYIAELRGLSQIASQQILELYSPGCRYDLGSRRCTVDIDALTLSGTVGTVTDDRIVFDGAPGGDDFATHGQITFTSGENSGFVMEVKKQTGGQLELWQPMPFPIVTGDAYSLAPGCDKTLATCRDRYDNLLNFGGFPHLPGEDRLAQVLVPKVPEVSTTNV